VEHKGTGALAPVLLLALIHPPSERIDSRKLAKEVLKITHLGYAPPQERFIGWCIIAAKGTKPPGYKDKE
jgi:hypothetical protein